MATLVHEVAVSGGVIRLTLAYEVENHVEGDGRSSVTVIRVTEIQSYTNISGVDSTHVAAYGLDGIVEGSAPIAVRTGTTQVVAMSDEITIPEGSSDAAKTFEFWNDTVQSASHSTATVSVPAWPQVELLVDFSPVIEGTMSWGRFPLYTSGIRVDELLGMAYGHPYVPLALNTKQDGSGTPYASGDTVDIDSVGDMVLYATLWERSTGSVTIGDATVIRTDSATDTDESDEGTYAYISVPVTVTGSSAAAISLAVTATADSGTVPTVSYDVQTLSKAEGTEYFTGALVARAGGCDTDTRYQFALTVTAVYSTGQRTVTKTATRTLVLPVSYYAIDVYPNGHGVGIGRPAVRNLFAVGMPSLLANGLVTTTENYGTCSTSGSTAAKVVELDGFELATGAEVLVGFANANTATGAITLDVNGTGAKTVHGGTYVTGAYASMAWGDGAAMRFRYDGTYWVYIGPLMEHATSSTAASESAKTVSVLLAGKEPFLLAPGRRIRVKFSNANTAPAPTLDVYSTGAKAIYHGGAAASASNPLSWAAGTTLEFVYDGTYWCLTGQVLSSSRESAYPLYIRSTAPTSTGTMPMLPCFVYCTSDNGLYYCEDDS